MMNFVFALADFVFRVVYFLSAIAISICINSFVVLLKVLPILCRILSFMLSIVVWILANLLLGLMGSGGKATNALSWLLVGCVVYLFIDQNLDLPYLPLPAPVRDVFRKTRRWLFGADDEPIEESNADNCSMENENNANDQEEAVAVRRRSRPSSSSPRSRRSPANSTPSGFLPSTGPSQRRDVGLVESEDEEEEDLAQARASPSQTSLCTVCLDRERNVAVFPCGHTHLCLSCASTICHGSNKCPTCRDDIQDYRVIYL